MAIFIMFPSQEMIDIWLRHNKYELVNSCGPLAFVRKRSILFNAGKNNFLGHVANEQQAIEIVKSISKLASEGDLLVLYDIPTQGQIFHAVTSNFPNVQHLVMYECPVAVMENGFKEYTLTTVSKRKRKHVRRSLARLARMGDVTIDWVRKHEWEHHFQRFFELLSESIVFRNEYYAGFFRKDYLKDIWAELTNNDFRISVLSLDGIPISYRTGFVFQNCFYGYMPVFDRAFKQFSLGNLHVNLVLEELSKLGIKKYDFSKGIASNKSNWASETNSLSVLLISLNTSIQSKLFLKWYWILETAKANFRKYGYTRMLRTIMYSFARKRNIQLRELRREFENREKICFLEAPDCDFQYFDFDYKYVKGLPLEARQTIVAKVATTMSMKQDLIIGIQGKHRALFSKQFNDPLLSWNV